MRLGPYSVSRLAVADVARLTGGSSAGGRWSMVFDLGHSDQPEVHSPLGRLVIEAAEIEAVLGKELNDETVQPLRQLASFGPTNAA